MEAKNKKCLNCNYYKAFYTKAYTCFVKEKFGGCFKCKQVVSNHNLCEFWQAKRNVKQRRKVAAISALVQAIENINIIKQILSEEQEEL